MIELLKLHYSWIASNYELKLKLRDFWTNPFEMIRIELFGIFFPKQIHEPKLDSRVSKSRFATLTAQDLLGFHLSLVLRTREKLKTLKFFENWPVSWYIIQTLSLWICDSNPYESFEVWIRKTN
jgi:hypothetical protein